MPAQLRFAFGYALRSMLRDRQRTLFALFCVAAGVATVVALRTLGLMLTDALTSNAQAFLRADVRVDDPGGGDLSVFGSTQDNVAFTADTVAAVNQWAAQNGVAVTYKLNNELMQVAVIHPDGLAGAPVIATAVFIDPQVYPFYDIIRAEDPAGVELHELFTGPRQTIIGRRLADQSGAQVGDQVRIGGAEMLYTVVGIVPDYAESSLSGGASFNALLFSFVYLDRAEQGDFGLPPDVATSAYLRIPADMTQRDAERLVRSEWPDPYRYNDRWDTTRAERVLETNTVIADTIGRFVLVLSLVGLVIGGVGIINTMLVTVNRRSDEIAVLKTLGLQGRSIALVFLAQALMLGLIGSLLGIVVGNILSLIARDLGQQAFAVPLPWRVYLDPAVMGVTLGVIMTLFFSFLPILLAGQVRPVYVLRQGSIPMARAGCLPSLLNFLLLVVGFGLLVDLIIGTQRIPTDIPAPLTLGIVSTFTTFVLLFIIVALMWLFVWVLGRLPAFRSANMRIAMRGLTTHRTRTAFSLLALIIGMSALSGTLILARSINTLLYVSISGPIGGNVIVMPLAFAQPAVHQILSSTEGVNGFRDVRFPAGWDLEAVDGNRNYWRWFDMDEDPQAGFRFAQLELVVGTTVYGSPTRAALHAGRFLGPEDAGQAHIVIPYIPELEANGVGLGSMLTYDVRGRNVNFTVVGIVAPDAAQGLIPFSLGDSAVHIPREMMPQNTAVPFDFVIADVEPERVNAAMSALAVLPGTFVFDVSVFDSIISRLMNQLAALPLLVAGLALFAATTLIATTVSLATLERRRQIATMKALGVSRRQVLGQLLLENGIVGAVGGIISLLPTVLILLAVPALTQGIVTLPVPYELIALMLVLAVGITLGATLVTAWGTSAEKPLNVLRYE